jgi:spermidine/putrescine transport system substrate-binding protein
MVANASLPWTEENAPMNLKQYARTIFAIVAVLGLLAGGASVSTAAQGSGSLTVLDWAGFDAEDFWIDFKNANPDVDVTFEIGASDADILAKMMAGSQADVFHPYTGWLQFYVEEGLVEEIDTSRLTNWDKVPERFKELGQFDGKQYFIPYDWGYSSILYRTDLAPDAGESWNAMFDEKYSGHISMWDDGVAAVDVASYAHGWDELNLTDEQFEQIKQDWIAQREHNLFYWSGEPELVEAMASGDVWVAYAWQGAYALLRAQDVPVAYANPEEGRNSWVGYYGIRKGTENLDNAYAFLDGKLADETAQNVVELFYYGTANQDVMDAITDPELIEVLAINDPTVLDRTHFSPNITTEQRDAWAEMWVDVKAS